MSISTADTALASSLRLGVNRLARRLRSERTVADGLAIGHLAALATLERHGPMTPGDLAAHERVQPPSMTRTLARLTSLGLVQRHPHPTDGRQQVLALTRDGAARLAADRRRKDAWLARRLRELPAPELETLRAAAAVLDRLAQS
ncbi:MAG: MarR family winged helix-turn-helix transcriptional regulator [Mycobacteriales bacterium]